MTGPRVAGAVTHKHKSRELPATKPSTGEAESEAGNAASSALSVHLGGGFAGALQAAVGQLQQLACLLSRLEEEHELALARVAATRPPPAAGRSAGEDQASELREDLQDRGAGAGDAARPQAARLEAKPPPPNRGAGEDQASEFREALQDQGFGDVARVQTLLQLGADPNVQLGSFQCKGLALTGSTPLPVAVLHQNLRMVRTLVEAKAAPDSEYSFMAGAERSVVSFPASHACIPSGDTQMLRELLLLGADVHSCSSTGASLLWEAAYFGSFEALKLLLQEHADLEKKACSQDDRALSYSPLHIAAKEGHAEAVRALLNAKASFLVDDDGTREPLDTAVEHGHADVVQLLVSRKADIFQGRKREASLPIRGPIHGAATCASLVTNFHAPCSSGTVSTLKELPRLRSLRKLERSCAVGGSLLTSKLVRRIDTVFSSGSPTLVHAVAKGLGEAPELPADFSRDDLIRFLTMPGEAATQIWKSIFKRQALAYWKQNEELLVRVARRSAFMPVDKDMNVVDKGMNIALGPTAKVLRDLYTRKETLPADLQGFLRILVPAAPASASDIFTPVRPYSCRVPDLHVDLELMLAIADCKTEEIFAELGCRALVDLMWKELKIGTRLKLLLTVVEVANFVWLSFLELDPAFSHLLDIAYGLALVIVGAASAEEICSAVGYTSEGLGCWYLRSGPHLFDNAVLALTSVVVIWIMVDRDSMGTPLYRTIFGLCAYLKWLRLLTELRQFKVVGVRILPILDTMWDVKFFLAVLIMYLAASVNMYYALGIHRLEDAALIIYRMTVIGDVNLNELENQSNMRLTAEGGDYVQVPPPRAEIFTPVVCVMMVFMSFVVGVSLMNLFVAMLCESYANALERAELMFMRARAVLVLDQQAVREGIQVLRCRRRRRLQQRRRPFLGTNRSADGGLEEETRLSHIWLCVAER